MERKIKAPAAREPRGKLGPFDFNAGELRPEQVEIKVSHCGMSHSDLSMRDNEWQMTAYPFVPGHEAVGDRVKHLKIGEKVERAFVRMLFARTSQSSISHSSLLRRKWDCLESLTYPLRGASFSQGLQVCSVNNGLAITPANQAVVPHSENDLYG